MHVLLVVLSTMLPSSYQLTELQVCVNISAVLLVTVHWTTSTYSVN